MIDFTPHLISFFDLAPEDAPNSSLFLNEIIRDVLSAQKGGISLSNAVSDQSGFAALHKFHDLVTTIAAPEWVEFFELGWEQNLGDVYKELLRALANMANSGEVEYAALAKVLVFEICFCAEFGEVMNGAERIGDLTERSETRALTLLSVAKILEGKVPTRRLGQIFQEIILIDKLDLPSMFNAPIGQA